MIRIVLSLAVVIASVASLNAATISEIEQVNPEFIKVEVYDTSGLFHFARVEQPDGPGPWIEFPEYHYTFWTDASSVFLGSASGWGSDYSIEWHPYAVEEEPLVGLRADLTIVTGDWQEGMEGGSINYVSFYSNGHTLMSIGARMSTVDPAPNAVPEPATLTLCGLALIGLGTISRRR